MIMANTATENEADSGTGSSGAPVTIRQIEKQDDDQLEERVSGSNSNYDSLEVCHKCPICDYEAPSAHALITHTKLIHPPKHETEMETTTENNNPPASDRNHRKIFECDVCNMKFSNGANMRRHKMRHTGVKPYECRVCQKRFFRKDHLAEHFTTHTKTLPYHCPICNRGFQRQIAMRAHFQNEHVGQHDLVKSCPLCNYRAGSMKSLRIHFFSKHGIDLDNPGAPGTQSQLIAAAAQQGFSPVEGALSSLNHLSPSLSVSVQSSVNANYSDSGDSNGGNRSGDNATPPMHFLTPHVEISMAEVPTAIYSPSVEHRSSHSSSGEIPRMVNGDSPNSPQSADSNSNAPSSSHIQPNSLRMEQETSITPSISLIPIKQEPGGDDYDGANNTTNKRNGLNSSLESDILQGSSSSNLNALIKVSPLKSLLRDDLKKKLMSRNSSTNRARSTTGSPHNFDNISPSSDPNGTITSTGTENPSDAWRYLGKRSPLQCLYCGIGFPDQTLYFLHKGCHSEANPWKCNICGEQCCNVYEFNSHLLSKSHE